MLVAGTAWAMSSTNYRLDWFLALTGAGGGGRASSSHYQVNLSDGASSAHPLAPEYTAAAWVLGRHPLSDYRGTSRLLLRQLTSRYPAPAVPA